MIARAAEGSVRDALSLLDQAIAHGGAENAPSGPAGGEEIRSMLGLADRARIIDLFEQLMKGDAQGALATLKELYDFGADPGQVLQDLANFTHVVTRMKVVPEAAEDPALTEEERRRGLELAKALSLRVLSRCWQMLLKGIEETAAASRPLAAADMVVVRIAHAADLPTPDEALKMLADREPAAAPAERGPARPVPEPPRRPPAERGRGRRAAVRRAAGDPAPTLVAAPARRAEARHGSPISRMWSPSPARCGTCR